MSANLDIAPHIDDRTILITGGTGSFGQRLAQELVTRYRPRRIIVFSRDELKQSDMREREPFASASNFRYFIGDVRDQERLEMAFRGVDVVVHAAAMKQVPTAEYNPFECIRTNIHGAENIVRAAMRAGVGRVVALSTDKAANPANLYGATKLASDKIFVAAKWLVGASANPLFAIVRYGNVVGSRGSVVPLFRKLVAQGATTLPITDPRMTRFWITLRQGVDFVLSSLPLMRGGEIFVPKIPSMKVTDLARVMAPHIKTRVTGIRPGEKLHEMLITEEDARLTLELPDRYIVRPSLYGEERHYHAEEKVMPEGFSFASNVNTDWLSDERFAKLLAETELDDTPKSARAAE